MGKVDWDVAKKMPWRLRNAMVEAEVRAILQGMHESAVLSTLELATFVVGAKYVGGTGPERPVVEAAQLLSRMAPHLPALATHDGEEIIRYGRRWRRWQWHGQRRDGEHDMKHFRDKMRDEGPEC